MSGNLRFARDEYIDYDLPSTDRDIQIRNYHSKPVRVRKDCTCCYCGYPIKKNEYALAFSVVVDDEWGYGHYCIGCVEDNISMKKGLIDSQTLFDRYCRRLETST